MLTDIQRDIIVGSLLGDGHLTKRGKNGNSELSIIRSLNDIEYLKWQYEHLKEFCGTPGTEIKTRYIFDKRYNKTYGRCSFSTLAKPEITAFYNDWYDKNKKRKLPNNLELTKLNIAVWFSDDGTVRRLYKNSVRLQFCTDNFTKEEVERLANLLSEKYTEKFTVCKRKGANDIKYRIQAMHRASMVLLKDIDEVFTFLPRKRDIYKDLLETDLADSKFNEKEYVDIKKLNDFILKGDGFRKIEICTKLQINEKSIRYHLNKYTKQNYLTTLKDKNNKTLIYTITDLGRENIGK